MNPEIEKLTNEVSELRNEIDGLKNNFQSHQHTGLDSRPIDGKSFAQTPLAKIQNPTSAGATYNQSQITSIVSSVNVIIEYLEDLHITSDQ